MKTESKESDALAMNEVQLLLAEKRTSLAVLRTGIAILALPLSVTSLLIATSKYYDVFQVLHLFLPLVFINCALVVLAVYLIVRAVRRMHAYDNLIHMIKLRHGMLKEFLD